MRQKLGSAFGRVFRRVADTKVGKLAGMAAMLPAYVLYCWLLEFFDLLKTRGQRQIPQVSFDLPRGRLIDRFETRAHREMGRWHPGKVLRRYEPKEGVSLEELRDDALDALHALGWPRVEPPGDAQTAYVGQQRIERDRVDAFVSMYHSTGAVTVELQRKR